MDFSVGNRWLRPSLLVMDLFKQKRRRCLPMRIVMVWIVAVILIFTFSLGWWVSVPVVIGVSHALNSTITAPQGRSIATAVEYVAYAWGPILICFILLWAVISSQRRDIDSVVYG